MERWWLLHRNKLRSRISPEHWEILLDKWDRACVYCGATENLTKDHLIPLSKGGTDTEDNVVPACLRCNQKKKDKLIGEWVPPNPHKRLRRKLGLW